jgi:hypothetical protein
MIKLIFLQIAVLAMLTGASVHAETQASDAAASEAGSSDPSNCPVCSAPIQQKPASERSQEASKKYVEWLLDTSRPAPSLDGSATTR